ncbi:MAG: EamA family transporter [Cyanobacteria bacterium P01_C01_bin.120]
MQLLPYFLVLVSAVTHGIWNFLAKRADDKDVFIGLSKLSEAILFLIPFIFLLFTIGVELNLWLFFVIVAAIFVFLNYFFLSQAYKCIDLSVAYPISRSSTLFLPILGYFFLDERIDAIGTLSIVLITVAVLGIQLDGFTRADFAGLWHNLTRPGILFALLAAFTVASYTIWDKVAVSQVHPFLYFYSYTALVSICYTVFMSANFSWVKIHQEWRNHKVSIMAVAVLNTFTYLLVLVALALSKATYVGALRQISLVIAVFLGWRILKEPLPAPKIFSVLLLTIGSGLIVFAS